VPPHHLVIGTRHPPCSSSLIYGICSSICRAVIFTSWFIALNLRPYLPNHLFNCCLPREAFDGDGDGKKCGRAIRVIGVGAVPRLEVAHAVRTPQNLTSAHVQATWQRRISLSSGVSPAISPNAI